MTALHDSLFHPTTIILSGCICRRRKQVCLSTRYQPVELTGALSLLLSKSPVTRCSLDFPFSILHIRSPNFLCLSVFLKGTELHKTSPCFLQWCEGESGEGGEGGEGEGVMWGLNFMSGEDAMKFLKGCTVSVIIGQ